MADNLAVAGAVVGLVLMLPGLANAQKPSDACLAAADRMMRIMAEVHPEFREALATKSDAERTEVIRERALAMQAHPPGCEVLLAMPDTSMRALARLGGRK